MTHPITPPPELVQQWRGEAVSNPEDTFSQSLAARAAQWGADQELEACLGEVSFLNSQALADRVRTARRPKPPSLKEDALRGLNGLAHRLEEAGLPADLSVIRRALEQLDD